MGAREVEKEDVLLQTGVLLPELLDELARLLLSFGF